MATDTLIHDYVQNQKRLLELELRSEEEQEQEEATKASSNKNEKNEEIGRASRIIRNLQVDEWRIGLMGRTVVDLIPIKGDVTTKEKNDTVGSEGNDDHHQQQLNDIQSKLKKKNHSNVIMLPAHKITVGDEVEIISKHYHTNNNNNNDSQSQQNNNNGRRKRTSGGVVSAVTDSMISIALYGNNNSHYQSSTIPPSSDNDQQDDDDTQILGSPPLTVVPKSSIEVHKKMIHILHKLQSEGINHEFAGKIIQGVFDPSILNDIEIVENNKCDNNEFVEFTPFNPNLDESQIDAIKFCLQDRPISLIHGPPGTGEMNE